MVVCLKNGVLYHRWCRRKKRAASMAAVISDLETKKDQSIRNRKRRLGTTNSDAGLPPP